MAGFISFYGVYTWESIYEIVAVRPRGKYSSLLIEYSVIVEL